MKNTKIYQMTLSSMLIAIGIIIPMFSPIKVIIEPASFTLASHVPIMIAMFISPPVTLAVCIGTTLGFLFGGFPITVVARAASQIVFALIGAYIIKKNSDILNDRKKFVLLIVVLSVIHAIGEVLVVTPFYLSGSNTNDFLYSIFVLVGIGTFIHSIIDFVIAKGVFSALRLNKN